MEQKLAELLEQMRGHSRVSERDVERGHGDADTTLIALVRLLAQGRKCKEQIEAIVTAYETVDRSY